jgi:hypothetical protein
MKTTWGNVELLRPPLELKTLVLEKVKRDDFKGLMLIPWWPRQNWFDEHLEHWADHRRIHPESTGDFGLRRLDQSPLATARTPLKRWSAALIEISPEACQRAAELDVWPNIKHLASRGPPRTERVDLVTWIRVQSS